MVWVKNHNFQLDPQLLSPDPCHPTHGWWKNRSCSLEARSCHQPGESMATGVSWCKLHPPWGNFHYRTGGIPQNHPFRGYSKGDGCWQKWTPPQKCSNVFLVGWDPSEEKMLACFFFNHGSSSNWFRYCNWSILQFLQILRLFNA